MPNDKKPYLTSSYERRKLLGVSALIALFLLTVFGFGTVKEMRIASDYACGCLEQHQAVVEDIEVEYGQDVHTGGSWHTHHITLRLDTMRVVDFGGHGLPTVDVSEEQKVTVGMSHNEPVTVNSQYVHTAWGVVESMFFLPLPPAVVIVVIQLYRLRRARLPGDVRMTAPYVMASVALAGVITLTSSFVVWWTIPAFLVSTLAPLAMFYAMGRRITHNK